ncbi:MAG: hypothetical protein FJX77_03805 [Armatimonadetes bacterium]|nr:hypothetical protein [Armatimonadota bacterium]
MQVVKARREWWIFGALTALALTPAIAALQEGAPEPSRAEIRAAIQGALPHLERGGAGYVKQRGCFACHHQTAAILAFRAAQSQGIPVSDAALQEQVEFTRSSLEKGRENYLQGKGQGGQVETAGYALLGLELAGRRPDPVTDAVAHYLLLRDADAGYWKVTANRPPSEASSFSATYLALRSLRVFGTAEQKEGIAGRRTRVLAWLQATSARDTEDRVFRLWALREAGSAPDELAAAAAELLQTQRADGGWAQLEGMESDAYATGTALSVLHETGRLKAGDPAYRRGLRFLLGSRRPEGVWQVVSRSKPFQPYFESGFPYGKDQWISSAATGWAVVALANGLK